MIRRAVLSLALLSTVALSAEAAGPCTSVRVQGCGRKARVCVGSRSSSEAEQRALDAFKKQYRCNAPSVTSYSSSCAEAGNDKCDIKL